METRIKIAVFILAVLLTIGVGYLVMGGMHWVFVYIASLSTGSLTANLRIGGAVVIGLIVVLRFYARHRARMARKKK